MGDPKDSCSNNGSELERKETSSNEPPYQFEEVSFLCITKDNFFRKCLISVVRSRWFERLVILIILLNCVMLALHNPSDLKCESQQCKTLDKLEKVVFTFFAAEMLMKMVAIGVFGQKGYFSDRWNILDFLIVIAGVMDIIGATGDFLTIIRLCRVFRPLRAINRVPSIRILVTLLMDTIPMLGNVLLLAFLVFSIFGILGVQLWEGKLRNRCFFPDNMNNTYNMTRFYYTGPPDYLCSLPKDDGMGSCPPNSTMLGCSINGEGVSKACKMAANYSKCKGDGPNPYYDTMSFDNIALAWIFIYQVVTCEGWSELMYFIQDSSSYYAWIYFVTFITIGSFFLVNLSLVVITMQFSETKRREMQLIREQKHKRMTESQISLISDVRIFWSKFLSLCSCKGRRKSIHHFHHHEHFHIHHHMIRCDKCTMFCGKSQPDAVSPKEVSSDNGNSIPKVEISCFDDEKVNTSQGLNKNLSSSCPSLFVCERTIERKLSETSFRPSNNTSIGAVQHSSLDKDTRFDNEQKPAQKSYLTPRIDIKGTWKETSAANTVSVTAESVSSISVDRKLSPTHASLTTKTSLSLQLNGNATQVTTEAYCEANGSVGKIGMKTALYSDARLKSGVTLHTPERRSLCKTYSNLSHNSEVRSDDVSDIADTSSEALYGSMFDLRNADKYYVSVEPTFFQKFRKHCKNLSESRKFSHFIMLFIILNTICMGLEHHNQPEKMTQILEHLNLVFIWIFGFEVCVKLLGVGPKSYFKVGYNVFDCLIVILSIAELLISNSDEREGKSKFIVLRSLRLLRIFKLVRPMRHQMMVMIRTMSNVMTFFALLFLFMFTFAILGMHVFGGTFTFNGETSPSNFDSFVAAMTTVFQILTQEDWNLVMYDGMRGTGHKAAALYFLALMTIGYYVLLNLLVAILVEGFTTPMEKRRMAKRIAAMLLSKNNSQSYHSGVVAVSMQDGRSKSTYDIPGSPFISANDELPQRSMSSYYLRTGNMDITKSLSVRSLTSVADVKMDLEAGDLVKPKPKPGEPILVSAKPRSSRSGSLNGVQSAFEAKDALHNRPVSTTESSKQSTLCLKSRQDWSLFILSPENRFRKLLQVIINSKWFDYFILLLIVYSCILLAMENPNKPSGRTKQKVIDTSMQVLTWIFSAEMIMKVLAQGLIIGHDTYLRKGWNILDGLLVLISWIDFILEHSGTTGHTKFMTVFRVLRALRSLRPLRMIRRAPGLKLVVQTLLYSLKPIGNTVLIAAIFFVVFGILGVQLMKGKFYHCEGDNDVLDKSGCENSTGKWVKYRYNFDNLGSALIALFVVSTKDGWVQIMRHGVDATGVDLQPKRNASPWRILYFISFLLLGGFLVLNMIVGVVVENFQRCRELQGDKDNAKKALAKWRECARTRVAQESFLKNYSRYRLALYKMCTHTYWIIGITVVILLNVICMAMQHYNMSKGLKDFIEVSNIVFTVFYGIEALLQIIAVGIKQYFKNKWYLFDFFVVVVSILGIALEEIIGTSINPSVVRGIRMLRVVRVLKLLKVAKGLQFLLDHVKETMPQVTNLVLLFSLLFFIYSCLGMHFFGTIECSAETKCDGLGVHANFKDISSSMLTLFRIATGDNWSGILKDTMRPDCDNSSDCKRNCCISYYSAPFFFISFVLFAQFVLVNIVIAVLMKHLRVTKLCKGNLHSRKNSIRQKAALKEESKQERGRGAFLKWQLAAGRSKADRDDNYVGQQQQQALLKQSKSITDALKGAKLQKCHVNPEESEFDRNPTDNNNVKTKISNESLLETDKNNLADQQARFEKEHLWRKNPSCRAQSEVSPDLASDKYSMTYEMEEGVGSVESVLYMNVLRDEKSQDSCQSANHVSDDEAHEISIEIPEDNEKCSEHGCCCSCYREESRTNVDAAKTCLLCSPTLGESEDLNGSTDEVGRTCCNTFFNGSSQTTIDEPLCQYDERISFTGSPILNIPDDFFSEDETTPLKSISWKDKTVNDHLNIDKTVKKNDAESTSFASSETTADLVRSESIETCGSFEILPEFLELCEMNENAEGSNESFAFVESDCNDVKLSKV